MAGPFLAAFFIAVPAILQMLNEQAEAVHLFGEFGKQRLLICRGLPGQ